MDHHQFEKLFPLGSHLCREPMPAMSELKADMENLKRHGFNLVKLQEHWQVDEPLEGHCDFSRYEELIAHAAKLEMGVYLGLTCEQAPHWLWDKHPGARMVGDNGVPVAFEAQSTLPSDGKPGPCFDHPGAMADQLRFIRKLVAVLGRCENVVVWNTWQEVAYWSEGLVGARVCYCDHTLAAYRRWLAERYGDLDALNRAWNTRYLRWESIVPNRLDRRSCALPQDVDWNYFMDNVQIARILRERAEAIRDADPLHRPVFAHKSAPIIGSGMDWTYARCQDFLGSSCYPAWQSLHAWDDNRPAPGRPLDRHAALLAETSQIALSYDYIRSCNPRGAPVWAAEFQGGPVSTGFHKGRVPSPDDIRRWMLTAVGAGVTGISFWVTRAEILAAEANGFSLLDSQGDTTPRFEEASRIGEAMNRHPELFGRPTWPGAEVAICINEWNYQFCRTMGQGSENLSYDVRGWHRLLWESGIPADFIEAAELEDDLAERYKAILLPFPLSMSEKVARHLAGYVERGGHLISEACPGRMDEHGFCRRGELSPAACELFGVRHETFTLVREPEGETRWSPPERTWGEYLDAAMLDGDGPLAGHRMRANLYVETFACQGSTPCLRYGRAVAGTVRRAGSGQAWLLGTFAGHSGTAYRDPETWACILAILEQCGARPQRAGELLLRKRVVNGKEAWLLTNPHDRDVTERIDAAGWSSVEDMLGEPLRREGDGVTLTVGSLDVRALVLTK